MKKSLKIFFIALLAFILLVVGFLTIRYLADGSRYKTFLLPRVEFSFVEVTSLTTEKTEMNLRLLIKNQLPFSFNVDSLEYSIFVDSAEIVESRYLKSIHINGNDSSWISLPVTIYNHRLTSVTNENDKQHIDTVEYHLKASFFTNIIFRKKFVIQIKRMLPLVHIPEPIVEHVEIDSLNLSRAAILVHVALNNKNVLPIESKNITYQFAIEDHEWIEGTMPGVLSIKAQSITNFVIPMRLSFKEVRKTLWALLVKGKQVKYKLHLRFKIESENNQLKDSKVVLESSGTVKSLLKVVKRKKSKKAE
ncbi:MAG: LEA type 2 family protein [Saprospiraceae bacterium]